MQTILPFSIINIYINLYNHTHNHNTLSSGYAISRKQNIHIKVYTENEPCLKSWTLFSLSYSADPTTTTTFRLRFVSLAYNVLFGIFMPHEVHDRVQWKWIFRIFFYSGTPIHIDWTMNKHTHTHTVYSKQDQLLIWEMIMLFELMSMSLLKHTDKKTSFQQIEKWLQTKFRERTREKNKKNKPLLQ